MMVQPLQHVEFEIPPNVHEIILVEDTFLGKLRSRAFKNASTLWFFTILWFVVLLASYVGHWLWG